MMVAALKCSLCLPSLLGGEPPHHYGVPYRNTREGILGGYECICTCALSPTADSGQPDPPDDYPREVTDGE